MATPELPTTLPSLLARIIAERGAHEAIATMAETISYAELDRRSAQMARALLARGAGKGTRIALLAPDGIFWVTAFLASLRIGALVTLVSTLGTPRELAYILRHSDTQMLIAARRFLRHDYAEHLGTAFPALAGQRAGTLRLIGAPYLRAVWFDDPGDLGWAGGIDELLAEIVGTDILAAVEAEVAAGEDAVIVYTSGSTAQPKVVVHTQWNLIRRWPGCSCSSPMTACCRCCPPSGWAGWPWQCRC